jgi:hypothetical protein
MDRVINEINSINRFSIEIMKERKKQKDETKQKQSINSDNRSLFNNRKLNDRVFCLNIFVPPLFF